MHIAQVQLVSSSPYSQSRPHGIPKLKKETSDDHEARTWHNRTHVEDGHVVIPAMALRNAISESAKFLSLQIPGKGKATYTKHFDSGIMILDSPRLYTHAGNPIVPASDLGLRKSLANSPNNPKEDPEALEYMPPLDEVWGDWVFVPADGVAGSGKRVFKCYPMISQWQAELTIHIMDDIITKEVFEEVLRTAGTLIGIGRFRVRNRGTYGRFEVRALKWD